jgi:copper(I)-binding protein
MSISPSRLRSLGLGLAAAAVLTGGLAACNRDNDASEKTAAAEGGSAASEGSEDTTAGTVEGTVPTVSNVWTEPAEEGADTAIYLSITGGATDDELVGVSISEEWAESVELVDGPVEVPATKTVQLVEDGPHIEVIGLQKAFIVNKPFHITLTFSNAPEQQVEGDVREQSLGEI